MDSMYSPPGVGQDASQFVPNSQQQQHSSDGLYPPPLPPRRPSSITYDEEKRIIPVDATDRYGPPPTRRRSNDGADVVGQAYIRDPHKLVAYLVPLPKPNYHKGMLHATGGAELPTRFLIYTPPPPPLQAPAEGEKEEKIHKLQRKWQEEVRTAKQSDAKVASWKGLKGRATKGIDWAMGKTTTSNLDFVNRIPGMSNSKDKHADDGVTEGETTKKTVGLNEMILIHPTSLPGSEEKINVSVRAKAVFPQRTEFINNMMRTKTKAQKDSMIATGLLPVAGAIDVLATIVWPFGGLLEIDGVWAANSIRGAKTARSVTKRLNSTGTTGNAEEDMLRLTFTPSQRIEVLQRYLEAKCHDRDPKYFKSPGLAPTETEVLAAIGWNPSSTGETRNWEDEQWEWQEVKEDLRATMLKGANEWTSWVKSFEKNPEKALKK